MFGKVINGVLTQYPTTVEQLRAIVSSQALLPQKLNDVIESGFVKSLGWVWVYDIPHVPINPEMEKLQYTDPYLFNGKWQRAATVVSLTMAERKEIFATKYVSLKEALDGVITDMVEQQAIKMGYHNRHGSAKSSLIDYIHSGIPQLRLEAESYVVWIDNIWMYIIGLQNDVEAGVISLPSPEQVLNGLPKFKMLTKK